MKIKRPAYDLDFIITDDMIANAALTTDSFETFQQQEITRDAKRISYLDHKFCNDKELLELEGLKKKYGMMPQTARLAQRPID